jgi:hypothetical protein
MQHGVFHDTAGSGRQVGEDSQPSTASTVGSARAVFSPLATGGETRSGVVSSERPVFPKPTFTAAELAAAVSVLLPRVPRRVWATAGARRIDPRLREIVLLAVSEANRCRYCQAAHV